MARTPCPATRRRAWAWTSSTWRWKAAARRSGSAFCGCTSIFRDMRAPALMHCKSGADRAGLAAGLFVLFQGGTAREALQQLSLRFGHIRQARTGILDAFFHHYAREAEGKKPFLDWVREDYDEAALRRDFHANGLASFINDWVLVHE